MRISDTQMQTMMLSSLHRSGSQYAELMQQMATGNKINKPSDDPLASMKIMGIERQQSATAQYQKNIESLQARLSSQETYTSNMLNSLQRVNELIILSNNDAVSQDGLDGIAIELTELRKSLMSAANAQDENGAYLFSGHQITTPAIAADNSYQGDNGSRDVLVSKGTYMQSNDTAATMFYANGTNLFQAIDDAIAALKDPTVDHAAEIAVLNDAWLASFSSINTIQTEMGGRQKTLEQFLGSHAEVELFQDTLLGKIESLDYAEATMEVNQISTALQATMASYSQVNQLSLVDYF
ncbi:flagellar hook-associated protein FlgL [Paraferrimonas sp. SM1919]|uniref:flagellar hook-associated protein FlgL n=1 Tax=Paraferrimonas sp. SM1919 TaxID=2662263 RepID=UPI0013D1DC87|nr:flagellar hook-associated protein FlgL [Paraferrimonas sp. SM1919]